jgi:hypothetical protein
MNLRSVFLLLAILNVGGVQADDPFDLRSAHDVNEGTLNFLADPLPHRTTITRTVSL